MKFKLIVILLFAMPYSILASSSDIRESVEKAINELGGIDMYMDWITSKEQQSMPYKKDSLDTFLSISYAKANKNRIITHRLTKGWRSLIANKKNITEAEAENFVKQFMEMSNKNYICSTDANRVYLENGVIISNTYNEDDGAFIFSTTTNINDCKTK